MLHEGRLRCYPRLSYICFSYGDIYFYYFDDGHTKGCFKYDGLHNTAIITYSILLAATHDLRAGLAIYYRPSSFCRQRYFVQHMIKTAL